MYIAHLFHCFHCSYAVKKRFNYELDFIYRFLFYITIDYNIS